MPAEIAKVGDEVEAPRDNHLALMTGDGTAVAIPPGATLIFVTGPNMEDRYPTILVKVDKKKMVFHCGCRKPGCTRQFTWKITGVAGNHPQRG